jgi:ribosomal protein S18 acetylase RimI-like enzyme
MKSNSNNFFHVAQLGNRVAGFIQWDKLQRAYLKFDSDFYTSINDVAVLPEFRKRGIRNEFIM